MDSDTASSGEPVPESGSAQRSNDLLERIWALQEDLAHFYADVRPDGFYSLPGDQRTTTWTRAIIHECCELDNELGWKPWKNPVDYAATRDRRLDEMADILHFFVQLALDQGFTASDIFSAYARKNQENRLRQTRDPRYQPQSGRSQQPAGE